MLHVNNLTGGYDKKRPTVQDVSFKVAKGRFFALLGPNGSGKTTIIRLIMGILPQVSGEVLVAGIPINHYSSVELAKKIAVLTQENQMGLDLTVEEVVHLGRYPYKSKSIFGESSSKDREVVEKVMELTNILPYKNKSFLSLSGGEKQRVLLAKALAQEPEILILDEPTNYLDIRHSLELLDLLKKLQSENGLTIIAILHDLNIASLYADSCGILKDGKLIKISEGLHELNENLLSSVYQADLKFLLHPEIPKMQITYLPQMKKKEENIKPFLLTQGEDQLILDLKSPFRTLSTGDGGKGFGWCERIAYYIGPAEKDEQMNPYTSLSWRCENLSQVKVIEGEITGYKCLFINITSTHNNSFNSIFFTEAEVEDSDLINIVVSLAEIRKGMTGNQFSDKPIGGHIVVGTNKQAFSKEQGYKTNVVNKEQFLHDIYKFINEKID